MIGQYFITELQRNFFFSIVFFSNISYKAFIVSQLDKKVIEGIAAGKTEWNDKRILKVSTKKFH